MLNIIKDVLITNKLNKLVNRSLVAKTDALKAQSTREMDIAMTKLCEIVVEYFSIRDMELKFADESLRDKIVIAKRLLSNNLRRCE